MLRLLIISTCVCLFMSATSDAAGVKKWVDSDGRTHYGERPPSEGDSSAVKENISVVEVAASGPAVVLYSTSRCGYCKKAKTFMNANKIAFREYDIEKDAVARATYKRLGGKGVPFLEMRGRTLYGFSANRYKRFFDL